jgi:hypothetical protein
MADQQDVKGLQPRLVVDDELGMLRAIKSLLWQPAHEPMLFGSSRVGRGVGTRPAGVSGFDKSKYRYR